MSTAENLVCYFKMNSSIDPLFVEMLYIPSTTEHETGPPSPETQQRSSSVSSNLLKDSRACLQLVQGDLIHIAHHFFHHSHGSTFSSLLFLRLLCLLLQAWTITAADMDKYSDNQMVRILTEPLQACPNKTMQCFQIHAIQHTFQCFQDKSSWRTNI